MGTVLVYTTIDELIILDDNIKCYSKESLFYKINGF